jgi:hypothetical protein
MNTHDSNRHNEDPWCDDCHGYTHMPWCPQYVEKVVGAAPEAKSIPSGDSEAVAGQCRERSDSSNEQETEQLIARIHAAMAGDCDCPQHRTGTAKIDPAVLERIPAAITRDQTFASLTTVRAAIADALDAGEDATGCACEAQRHAWSFSFREDEQETEKRSRLIDAVTARILALQREPHGVDAGLREDALDSHEFYELMQAYRRAGIVDQDTTVAAFEAVKSFVRARNVSETVSPAAAIRHDSEAREGEQR